MLLKSGNMTSYVSVSCASRLQVVWISVVYIYKGILLAVGLYFTWNTRQVHQTLIGLQLPLSGDYFVLCVLI